MILWNELCSKTEFDTLVRKREEDLKKKLVSYSESQKNISK